MKIYTVARKCCDGIDVGVVLRNNNDEICLKSGFKVADFKEYEGHLMGIRRGLSYIKNVKPQNLDEDVICIFSSKDSEWINLRLKEDRYIRTLKKYLHINIDTKEPTKDDEQYLNIANTYSKSYGIKEFVLNSNQYE